jgi:hypothetical protein
MSSVSSVGSLLFSEENQISAVRIQSIYRGYRVRKLTKESFLAKALRSGFDQLINARHNMPQSEWGNAQVYLPNHVPQVVLKETKASYYRLCLMSFARKVCKINQSSGLVVPKALISKDFEFLLEQRLSFDLNIIEQERLVKTYSQSDTIRELTRFVLDTDLWDIALMDRCVTSSFPWVRFDNIPLFETRQGDQAQLNIGLIDVEGISTRLEGKFFYLLPKLVYIFPYSDNLILEEASKKGIAEEEIRALKPSLDQSKKLGLERNNRYCDQLIAYLEDKKQNRAGLESLTDVKQKEISTELAKFYGIEDEHLPLVEAYVRKLAELLIGIKESTPSHNSVYGEKVICRNLAYYDWPLCEYGEKIYQSYPNIIFKLEIALKKMVEKRVIYDVFMRGHLILITI